MPVFGAYRVAGMGPVSMSTGSAPRQLMWWMRARGVSPWSLTACSEASRTALAPSADLAGHCGGHPAALAQRLKRGHLLQGCVPGCFVHREALDRDDLVAEATAADGGQGAFVASQSPALHVLAGDVPALGDQFGAAELGDLLIAVALQPALGLCGGGGEAELLHRRSSQRRSGSGSCSAYRRPGSDPPFPP